MAEITSRLEGMELKTEEKDTLLVALVVRSVRAVTLRTETYWNFSTRISGFLTNNQDQ